MTGPTRAVRGFGPVRVAPRRAVAVATPAAVGRRATAVFVAATVSFLGG